MVNATRTSTPRARASSPARTRRKMDGLIDPGSGAPADGQRETRGDTAAFARCIATHAGDFSHACILPPTGAWPGMNRSAPADGVLVHVAVGGAQRDLERPCG